MSTYKATPSYKVYVVTLGLGGEPGRNYILSDTNPHTEAFPNWDAAHRWIQDSGSRQVNYTILEIYAKM